MRIYIDESGNFQPDAAVSRYCCEAAVVIPDQFAPELFDRFVALRKGWTNEPEKKGSSLTDDETAAALTLLGEYDVMVQIAALDVGIHSTAQIAEFQRRQGAGFMNGLTPQHREAPRKFVTQLRDDWLALSPQLATQLYVLLLTLEEVIQYALNYYAQRLPEELGRFEWVLDPKDIKPTPFEQCWRKVVHPLLQTISLERRFIHVTGGPFDYSALEPFRDEAPEYLKPHMTSEPPEDFKHLNLGKLFANISFPDSKDAPGLQLADIVASAFTKAMNGKLPPEVWRLLARSMVHKVKGEPVARFVALGEGPVEKLNRYRNYVAKALHNRAKPFLIRDTDDDDGDEEE
jgi:hypothetical protein